MQARRWLLTGQVQGVGFRPFVYRLASAAGLRGWVVNRVGTVEIVAAGDEGVLDRFAADLLAQAPPLARPRILSTRPAPVPQTDGFAILDSDAAATPDIHLPVDTFTCDACLAELRDPGDRRFRYPFINCTQCGPRYTLIESLPYDRSRTSMAAFPLCADCEREYLNLLDRRFHAEPVACSRCGPRLSYASLCPCPPSEGEAALGACVEALGKGQIVAVKGIGGYHLVCDATRDQPVRRLRDRKPRPDKPLAVMFAAPGEDPLRQLREHCYLLPAEERLLLSPQRPIVLLRRRPGGSLSSLIAPGLDEIGAMLPYSPLHHLLLDACGSPLVATSANISGEPVLTEREQVASRLQHVAEAFLHHDRAILRPADDSVYRTLDGRPRPLRLGRGGSPLELELPYRLPRPVLALGGQMKNTLTLGWERRAVVSPHIGEMGSPRSIQVLQTLVEDLQQLYRVRAELLLCDAHPDYATHRWARRHGLPVVAVWHHHAHAASLALDSDAEEPLLAFCWDGVGLGPDGALWGGETLLGRPGSWRRLASFRPFRLPGGERVAREPWRSAASLCWHAGVAWPQSPALDGLLHQAWRNGLNAPWSSAVGRLFDAAAALAGVCQQASFEGQGPMLLEALAEDHAPALDLPAAVDADGVLRYDWAPLLPLLLDRRQTPGWRAALLHETLAQVLLAQARRFAGQYGVRQVGLAGGVFQNRRLTDRVMLGLRLAGLTPRLPQRIPVNDGGLSLGQLLDWAGGAGAGG